MVEETIRFALKVEHNLEHLAEMSTDGSADEAEKEWKEMRHIAEQAALLALKTTETWGKQSLNKIKEHVEEISL